MHQRERIDLLVFQDASMDVYLKHKVLSPHKLSPLEQLVGILNPDLMNLDLLKHKRLLVVLKIESHSFVFEVVVWISESLDLL
jgi:hypothetical protein